jgi:hypothetical protein
MRTETAIGAALLAVGLWWLVTRGTRAGLPIAGSAFLPVVQPAPVNREAVLSQAELLNQTLAQQGLGGQPIDRTMTWGTIAAGPSQPWGAGSGSVLNAWLR